MSSEERHINFRLMRQYILDQQERDAPAGSQPSISKTAAKRYWRSVEEFVDTPAFQEFVRREYPLHAETWDDPIERRTLLKLMGASLALAGLSGCVYQPPEKIVPYVRQPEGAIPGKPLFYATAATVSGIATPVLARSNEGRPTKIEGNADHPNSRLGTDDSGSSATDIFAQASILTLYDPSRSETLTFREEIRTWSTFVGDLRSALDGQRAKQGAGIRFLTETITSPTLGAQLQATLAAFPQAKWHQYEPVNRDNARAGALLAFGQPVNTIYDFSKAHRIVSLDSDYLSCKPGLLRYARDFAALRRRAREQKEVSRLYVFESTPTTTGASADHHWAVRPGEVEGIARILFELLRSPQSSAAQDRSSLDYSVWKSGDRKTFETLVKDLQQHRGSSIVIAGDEQPPVVHALAHAMNDALGNVGQTVFYTDPIETNWVDQRESLTDLVREIDAGRVELLIILGGNPAYNTPADLKLDLNRLSKVKLRVHLSQYKDETSEICQWHIPEAHYLESWSDTRSYDGTVSVVQPLIEPLYDGKTGHELLAIFSDQYDRRPYDIVRSYWQGAGAGGRGPEQVAGGRGQEQVAGGRGQEAGATGPSLDFEAWWRKVLHDGYVPNTALPRKTVALKADWATQPSQSTLTTSDDTGFELLIRTDPTIYDGRFANNGWLQELPKPLTKLTWENAALVSPETATRLGLENKIGRKGGDISVSNIRIESRGRWVICPCWIMPGQPDNVITVHLGYGRRRAGEVGSGYGFSAYDLRTSDTPWLAKAVKVEKAAGASVIAATQIHFNMEGRDILRSTTYEKYLKGEAPHGDAHDPTAEETLYGNPFKYDGYAWGMAIDANSCVGCNACIVACQSENNIPMVGKEQIERSREMHWLRVDTYFQGDPKHPESTNFMPVPCMHCENAPCEPVCPVHATVHSAEGLNDMVYNRCVGTRYCSNNCPYKVRRFNFLLYQDWDAPTYQLMRNPEVSVRSRGVMEKCTYCVQRIQAAKIGAELESRPVRDGEVVTACQAVCPTEAIVFGNINDPNSRVSKLKAESRNYALLADLNTRPRTTYLAVLRNPNPEIATTAPDTGSESH